MSTNVIKRTPTPGGPSYNPGGPFYVPPQGQYGQRDRDFHVGFDYAAPAGTPIPAASNGEVAVRDKVALEIIVRCGVGTWSSGFGWK